MSDGNKPLAKPCYFCLCLKRGGGGAHGCDLSLVVEFTTACAISAYYR